MPLHVAIVNLCNAETNTTEWKFTFVTVDKTEHMTAFFLLRMSVTLEKRKTKGVSKEKN